MSSRSDLNTKELLITVDHAARSLNKHEQRHLHEPSAASGLTGGPVGDFQHQFAVLLPNTAFLSGEKWATLWEVVVLASIRGQLQCWQFWRRGKWRVINRVGPIHLPV